jgi:hypothetical protein
MLMIIVSLFAMMLNSYRGIFLSSQGIILPQGKSFPFGGEENSPQIRMAVEGDPEQIKDFPFHPVGPFPNRKNGGDAG